jgi:hypothetical protein
MWSLPAFGSGRSGGSFGSALGQRLADLLAGDAGVAEKLLVVQHRAVALALVGTAGGGADGGGGALDGGDHELAEIEIGGDGALADT